MRHTLLTTGLALALGLWAQPSHAALPAGISGSWFNPAQPGHGLSVQVLEDDRALAFWFVYDPAGNPLHLYIEGAVAGTTISGPAWLGHGMRFGSFDPDDHQLIPWGTVSIDFADCSSGQLQWQASGPGGAGFGDGSLPIRRLSRIAGTTCDLAAPVGAPAGVYSGTLTGNGQFRGGDLHALVDADGGFWAALEVLGYPPAINWGFTGGVLTGAVDAALPGTASIDAELRTNEWLRHLGQAPWHLEPKHPPLPIELSLVHSGAGTASIAGSTQIAGQRFDVALARGPEAPVLDAVGSVADLAGSYGFTPVSMYTAGAELLITIEADGDLCIHDVESVCVFAGTVSVADEGGQLQFSVSHHERSQVVFEGIGWREQGGDAPPTLVLVATEGAHGFGIVAEQH